MRRDEATPNLPQPKSDAERNGTDAEVRARMPRHAAARLEGDGGVAATLENAAACSQSLINGDR
eukprot:5838808-Pyramimonas_sp.AAC.1